MDFKNAGLYDHHNSDRLVSGLPFYDGLHGFLSSHMAQMPLILPSKQSPKRLLAILAN